MREGGSKNNKKRRERKRVTDSALHHPLFSKLPLVYALLIKGSAKNCPSPTYLPVSHPTPNPHTHSLQENSPGRSRRGTGGLFRRVTGEGRMTVKQKEKATEEEKEEEKTSSEAIPQNSIGWVDRCGPVTLYVTPILPLLLLLESMTETRGEWGRVS